MCACVCACVLREDGEERGGGEGRRGVGLSCPHTLLPAKATTKGPPTTRERETNAGEGPT